MPSTSAHSDIGMKASGSHDASSSASAAALVGCPKPRSAQCPARAAANAPNAPTSPNAPIAVCESV